MANRCNTTIELVRSGIGESFMLEDRDDYAPYANACRIRTPFFYPNNDPMVIYAELDGERRIRLSDHGEANDYAFLSGAGSRITQERMRSLQARLGVAVRGTAFEVETAPEQVGDALSRLVTAMHDLSTLTYIQPSRQQRRTFDRKVEEYLASLRRPYFPRFPVEGDSKTHTIDYLIKGDKNTSLFMWTFDPKPSASPKKASEIAFSFIDITRKSAELEDQFVVLLNRHDEWSDSKEYLEGFQVLRNYIPNTFDWADRRRIEPMLSAA